MMEDSLRRMLCTIDRIMGQMDMQALPPIPSTIIAELKRWFGNLHNVRTDEEFYLTADGLVSSYLGTIFSDRKQEQFARAVLTASGYATLEFAEFRIGGFFSFLLCRPQDRIRIYNVWKHNEFRIYAQITKE